MKRLSFHYHLKISMDAPVSSHHFTLRCTPMSDERQHIEQLQHFVFPEDYLSRSRDQWGNTLLYGCFHGQHSCFEAFVCGRAETGLAAGTAVRDLEKARIFSFTTSTSPTGLSAITRSSPSSLSSSELSSVSLSSASKVKFRFS